MSVARGRRLACFKCKRRIRSKMTREKHCVHKCFTKSFVEGPNNKVVTKAACNYCRWVNLSNTTRLIKHIKECLKCPKDVKDKVAGQKNVDNGQQDNFDLDDDSNVVTTHTNNKRMKINKSMENYICREKSITELMQAELEILFARAVYCSSAPLSIVENDYWIDFFKKLKSSFNLPSRYELANRLLSQEFARIEERVEQKVATASCLALQMDGWSNIRRQSIVNVVLNTPEPFFFETIDTGADRHTGEKIAQLMISALIKVGPMKVVAIVTDNASSMKLAWRIVQEQYPHITAYGCLLHGIHLFFKDICMEISVIVEIKNYCSEITKEVRSSQILLTVLKEKQTAIKDAATSAGAVSKLTALQVQGKTRFGTIFFCIRSVAVNRSALRELCVDSRTENVLNAEIKEILLNSNFWEVLQECVTFLQPFISWLYKVESDEPRISSACTTFVEIRKHIQNVPDSRFLAEHYPKISQILEERYDFCVKPVHYAANLLDPSKRGIDLIDEELLEAQEYLVKLANYYSESENISVEEVLTDCNLFRLKEGVWKKVSLNITHRSMTPYMWWRACCVGKSPRAVALKVLGLPVTSAACERTNSTYGYVHNKNTNRLLTERAGKLTYVKQNWKYLYASENPKPQKKIPEIIIDDELYEIEDELEADSMEIIEAENQIMAENVDEAFLSQRLENFQNNSVE